jgi:serine/threonine protein kinase
MDQIGTRSLRKLNSDDPDVDKKSYSDLVKRARQGLRKNANSFKPYKQQDEFRYIKATDEKNRSSCMQNRGWIKEKPQLAKGNFGSIWKTQNAKLKGQYVVKKSNIETASRRESAYRDEYFTRLLDGTGITPGFVDAWICNGHHYMIMNFWDGGDAYEALPFDPEDFGMPNGIGFHESDLTRMKEICKTMSDYHVIHGDLKLDQFLTRFNEEEGTRDICVTDFGTAFDFKKFMPMLDPTKPNLTVTGWVGNYFGCKPVKHFYYSRNLWELEKNIFMSWSNMPIWILKGFEQPDGWRPKHDEDYGVPIYYEFTGFSEISDDDRRDFNILCGLPEKSMVKSRSGGK